MLMVTMQTARAIPIQRSVTDCEKKLGCLNTFSSFLVHPRKKGERGRGKKSTSKGLSPCPEH